MDSLKIFHQHLCGRSYRQLGREYGVSHQTIASICQSYAPHHKLSLVISLIADYPEHKDIFLSEWEKYLSDEHFYSHKNIKMLSKYSYPLNEQIWIS